MNRKMASKAHVHALCIMPFMDHALHPKTHWFDFLILDYQEKAQIILNLLLLASTCKLGPSSKNTFNSEKVQSTVFQHLLQFLLLFSSQITKRKRIFIQTKLFIMVVVIIIIMFNCSLFTCEILHQGGIVIIMVMFNLHVYLVINWV